MKEETQRVPQATSKRLPLYYRFIQKLANEGKERVSSQELSETMKIDSATIRRDFSYFGALGKKGYGYDVRRLLEFFRKTLDQDEAVNLALVGVGSLGNAFLKYNFEKNHNTRIVVAFDTNASEEGTMSNGIPIFPPERLEEKLPDFGVQMAVLTVPARAAQDMADRLAALGVKGILNFAPVRLNVPEGVRVHSIDLSVEMQALIYAIRNDEKNSQTPRR
ncbi:redox-sensing transcriptional repressor Rex [Bhargavaea ginsengi]|uniref:redox-sensing transcriptional repressor Rex n=1 Tax=Bhargavaea ginsengi TaxID=426757 RepID=UPI00203BC4CC|nr:redox-sensing transcriptional repressor Rex [Bhargavaea ginsengi]MCM3088438.1 redox-sensing transcriptional repressor Rex [Bhargavaea ginsengi]